MSKTFWVTFGQDHYHNIRGVIFDKDCVFEFQAKDYESARKIAFNMFDRKWAFLYMDDKKPTMSLYPRGIIKF